MVEPPLGARDDEHAAGSERDCLVEGELEVGRVLGGRVAGRPGARAARAAQRSSEDRVEVADHDVDHETERARAVGAAVGGEDGRAPRARTTAGPGPAATTTTSGSFTRSSAGITQIRFCGSAAR